MKNELHVTTPEALARDYPAVPGWVRDWCFRRGERQLALTLSADGLNCSVRSGALELEFDAVGSRRELPSAPLLRAAILAQTGRAALTTVPGDLSVATVAAGGAP